jgi:hypothetical protein
MLIPVFIRVNARVDVASSFVLETVAGANLPLLFPELRVYNRSASSDLSVMLERTHVYANQSDPLFTGTFTETLLSVVTIGSGESVVASPDVLGQSLLNANAALTSTLTVSNAGPDLTALVSFELRGLIESSYSNNSTMIVNGA